MKPQGSLVMRLGWVLILASVVFIGSLGATWPWIAAGGMALVVLVGLASLCKLIGL